ncbi:hypothetical protein GCM10007415_39780 [Parapedobacter pyrenivorans]|uniref:DUF4998 domain-containing protein n=1 Tax=Parapedobacter pyrenivorans TaxID=1305674 RepID=A0A917HZQ5_9SPHI|nr:DUF4998 domain-containing protein [Parapedobacter pyrenivorans]GGG99961.1 hypothetical protein GCM10007415_39780 [Parapedobacter pyrenivorans]
MKNYLIISLFGAVAAMAYACDKFTDVHQEFIEGGELVYAPKLDSVSVVAGENRVSLSMWYYNGHNLKETVVYWNSQQDSLVIDLIPFSIKSGMDSIDVIVPDLPENAYSFYLQNIDGNGNRSVLASAFGSVYGSDFQSLITNRRIREIHMQEGGFEVSWLAADETLIFTELRYVDSTTGQEKVVRKPAQSTSTYAIRVKENQFSYRSLYIPEPQAIDTFYTAWSDPIALPE